MTKHEAAHELSQAMANVLLAERKTLAMPLSEDRTDLLFYIREVKYKLELVVDRGFAKDLAKQ